jgi:hypothetical protein
MLEVREVVDHDFAVGGKELLYRPGELTEQRQVLL